MKKYKAILFDFDGVIGKTMEDNYRAWKNAFAKHNIVVTKKEYFLLEGMNVKNVALYFLKKNRCSQKLLKKIIDEKEKYYRNHNKFRLYSGVKKIISYLQKKKYLLGLVTGGERTRIMRTLRDNKLNIFDVVITGDEIRKCKPDPEPYLTAAKKLKTMPSQCLVVENAPLGIESAQRAGIHSIAVCSTLDKKYLKNADKIINKISELKKYVSK